MNSGWQVQHEISVLAKLRHFPGIASHRYTAGVFAENYDCSVVSFGTFSLPSSGKKSAYAQ